MNLAPSSTVTDKYFGINIVDEYRNLENLKDSSVVNWMREQTKYSTNTLKSISNRQYYIDKRKELFNKNGNYIKQLKQENTQLKQQLKDIEEYLESIKDMPDADMYIKLGEYEEFKHILDLIHKGSD